MFCDKPLIPAPTYNLAQSPCSCRYATKTYGHSLHCISPAVVVAALLHLMHGAIYSHLPESVKQSAMNTSSAVTANPVCIYMDNTGPSSAPLGTPETVRRVALAADWQFIVRRESYSKTCDKITAGLGSLSKKLIFSVHEIA